MQDKVNSIRGMAAEAYEDFESARNDASRSNAASKALIKLRGELVQGEAAHAGTALGTAQLRVTDHPAHDDDVVQHIAYPPSKFCLLQRGQLLQGRIGKPYRLVRFPEFVSKYFTKGRMAVASGRLQLRDWKDRDGNKRRSAEIVTDNVYFGDSKKEQEPPEAAHGASDGFPVKIKLLQTGMMIFASRTPCRASIAACFTSDGFH